MRSKSLRAAMVVVALACLSSGCSTINVQTQGPPSYSDRSTGTVASAAVVVYSQPPSPGGGLSQSSRNGTDYDQYAWDDFTLGSTHEITEIHWRGGYDPARLGSGGPVIDFIVAIYPSIAAGTQPDALNPPLVQYQTGGNAGETPAGNYGGIAMYDYGFILPAPFQATGGTRYWVQIEAPQGGIPDWGIAAGTGGDGKHFRRIAAAGDVFYQVAPGDAAFTLLGT